MKDNITDPVSKHLPPRELIADQVRQALREDVGEGDPTAALIPERNKSQVQVLSREAAVLCGCAWFQEVFRQLDPAIELTWHAADGERISEGQMICGMSGDTRALLTGERTALNYLQTLSGVATLARRYADAVSGMRVRVLDTRKTLPGLRRQQKYAVVCGGCHNHRMGLFDAVLIKENHIRALGSIKKALEEARLQATGFAIEIEVESLGELREALEAGADRILLDNFSLPDMREAVKIANGKARLEASGGIRLDNIREVAATGVEDISVGSLTKDVRAVDLSMQFV